MFSAQEKADVVQEYIRTGSISRARRNVVRTMVKRSPSPKSIRRWHLRFLQTGIVHDLTRSGRPRTSTERINAVR